MVGLKISQLIEKLSQIKEEQGDLTVCTYDSVLEDYHENVCLESVEDYYLNIFEDKSYGKILLL